ncbi:signal peptide containing protein [Theileria equi strain WA]|uniref:Signal peptide containing protein n=1 Tax=Theileria equi strain WA TaxID=1537102 RepID=L1LB76_THEEQ|nr:signal peptide containing protein [Theileria equi strain WA]EKX72408.1 signal peptide containing protein [Theileria equi strain WA]|eukprot:XP_004831860.1 signal peptide containing protein [Theileria equi strain WA]
MKAPWTILTLSATGICAGIALILSVINMNDPAAIPAPFPLDITVPDSDKVSVSIVEYDGIEHKILSANTEEMIAELRNGEMTVWNDEKNRGASTIHIFSKCGETRLMEVFAGPRSSPSIIYLEYSGGQWTQINVSTYNERWNDLFNDDPCTINKGAIVTLDLASVLQDNFITHNGASDGLSYRLYIPKEGFACTKITDGKEEIWSADCAYNNVDYDYAYYNGNNAVCYTDESSKGSQENRILPSMAGVYLKEGLPALLYLYLKGVNARDSRQRLECYAKQDGDWTRIRPMDFDQKVYALQDVHHTSRHRELIMDISRLSSYTPSRDGVEILHNSEEDPFLTVISLPNVKVVEIAEDTQTIWTAEDGESCDLASLFFKGKRPILAELVVNKPGSDGMDGVNETKILHFEKRLFGWYRMTEKLYKFKLEGFMSPKKGGFIPHSLFIIPVMIALGMSL